MRFMSSKANYAAVFSFLSIAFLVTACSRSSGANEGTPSQQTSPQTVDTSSARPSSASTPDAPATPNDLVRVTRIPVVDTPTVDCNTEDGNGRRVGARLTEGGPIEEFAVTENLCEGLVDLLPDNRADGSGEGLFVFHVAPADATTQGPTAQLRRILGVELAPESDQGALVLGEGENYYLTEEASPMEALRVAVISVQCSGHNSPQISFRTGTESSSPALTALLSPSLCSLLSQSMPAQDSPAREVNLYLLTTTDSTSNVESYVRAIEVFGQPNSLWIERSTTVAPTP